MPPLLLPSSSINKLPSLQPYVVSSTFFSVSQTLQKSESLTKRATDTSVLFLALRYGVAVLSYCGYKVLENPQARFLHDEEQPPTKAQVMLDFNLMMQKGKLLSKSLGGISCSTTTTSQAAVQLHQMAIYVPDEYEFSCSITPIPTFVPVNSKHKHSYFPCIGATPVDEPDRTPGPDAMMLPRFEYSPQSAYNFNDQASGERQTPVPSPFLVRVLNYSLAEDGDVLS